MADGELWRALDMIRDGYFSPDEPDRFRSIFDALTSQGDHFMLLADYRAYVDCQDRVSALYRDEDEWSRRAVLNIAGMGLFSSDRAILEYANTIWQVSPVQPEPAEDTAPIRTHMVSTDDFDQIGSTPN